MDAEERREASQAFSDTLRAKWAESRRGLTAEDLMGGTRGHDQEPEQAAEEEDR